MVSKILRINLQYLLYISFIHFIFQHQIDLLKQQTRREFCFSQDICRTLKKNSNIKKKVYVTSIKSNCRFFQTLSEYFSQEYLNKDNLYSLPGGALFAFLPSCQFLLFCPGRKLMDMRHKVKDLQLKAPFIDLNVARKSLLKEGSKVLETMPLFSDLF